MNKTQDVYQKFICLYDTSKGRISKRDLTANMKRVGLNSNSEALKCFILVGLIIKISHGVYNVPYPSLNKVVEGYKLIHEAAKKRQQKYLSRKEKGKVKNRVKVEVVETKILPSIEECINILVNEGYFVHKLQEGETLTFTKTITKQ